jgi:hypothetical protein
VLSQVLVGRVKLWLVATGVLDTGLEIVGDNDLGYPTQEGEGPHVSANPVGKVLARLSLSIGVVAGAQGGHEDLSLSDLSGVGIDYGDCLSGVVHEQLLPGFVGEAHGWVQAFGPLPVECTELAVPVAVRGSLSILNPQQA